MIWEELQSELDTLQRDGLKRQRRTLECPCGPVARLEGRSLLSFCSNDYLGLANDPALVEAACAGARAWGVGSGASHLVSGHLGAHAVLEEKLAAFTGFARALLFSTGYLANLGIVPALVGRHDAVFADRLNHASLIDAVQLARADSQRYPHGDLAALERLLATSPARRKLILSDAVFSMDGDLAPLPGLLALAERFDAWLVVDDAHGFGVLGRQGRGSLDHFNLPAARRLVYMGTLGKAAGAAGAFVAGDATVIEWLEQRARSYIFTTAASPIIACALATSLDLIAAGDARRQHLRQLVAQLRAGLADTRWQLLPSSTAIQPVIIGDNHEVLGVASALFERGLWVPAIRPPTVPRGSARLRVSLTAAHREADLARLVDALRALA
ncbi:MAG TPA: 8-amino-7-oxononanoate synthase [Accumulibacter sp.]|uniref:8-amino-7-oxononanoate synthase n=2 Tax=Candidatus Accumulibacter TaxID=327159 RepID=A0A080MCN4_9PROT|nr:MULTISPECIES: 8-amino-7-oxononanoate synthase [Candidatus Accumulibacter]KFB74939.1 MAG: 8-amino-7-oxononanoate synthase 2 [Candidatus Accumulibacter cognatus]MBL8402037.1 8-amino-7-oxononanoate synthase [Accumulibacter sp.]MBN8519344.1 8-amino-7-oxononanoate synthase [Accumulibacter sp.]MBO3711079.1 8-amino-7-oxononanoate synthase [Accumulibacter sp.]MCC2866887.1 8-amino-7-oxononanoate synthase [Candidatus Accumulibacter phosphatis]